MHKYKNDLMSLIHGFWMAKKNPAIVEIVNALLPYIIENIHLISTPSCLNDNKIFYGDIVDLKWK